MAAGREAYQTMQAAYREAEQEQYETSISILNSLVEQYPGYAEGYNQRAAVYWQLGRREESILDSEKTLSLNPHHYGAWQGLGIGLLHAGDLAEAVRCFRSALRIIPYDQATRDALLRCEDMVRVFPSATRPGGPQVIL